MAQKSSKKHTATQHHPRLLNRELSWLAFNERVLEEATNTLNPLLERLNFLSISETNLDEFMMVRMAGLMDHIRHGSAHISDDGLTPETQLKLLDARNRVIIEKQQKTFVTLRKELEKEDIAIIPREALSKQEVKWLAAYFMDNIYPALTPIAIDPAHPFPFLPNLSIAQLFLLTRGDKKKEQIAVVPFPPKIPRFIALPHLTKKNKKSVRYIALEHVIEQNWKFLFPDCDCLASTIFRILRDSDLEIEEEAEDLVRYFERAVKQRRRGRVISVQMASTIPEHLFEFLTTQMQVESGDVILMRGLVGLSNLTEIVETKRPDLKFTPYNVRFPERISDYEGNCFAAIEAKDIIVHHPFESFDVVVQFLNQAAEDANVVSIKQTLYRTSDNSPIVQALIKAAEAGKSVTALVELKARFDEEANIKWARDLERAGAQVVFGFVHLKTHTKVSLVTRRVDGKLRSYMHFGTGNYHSNTAKVYTDLSFFTCDPKLCHDAAQLFNFLTGYSPPQALSKLVVAPRDLRKTLLALIDREIAMVKAGKPGVIWAKMNALVDTTIIEALYNASNHGVQIDLIIRGMCCLRPGVAGMSANIRVKSIVGRFLEHARILFGDGQGLPSPNAKVYLSSADWMQRNFDWRIEAMIPIENPTVHAQVMSQIMVANIRDEKNSWSLHSDGSYTRHAVTEKSFSAHEYFMHNPSLSGRGKALKKNKTMFKDLYKLRKR